MNSEVQRVFGNEFQYNAVAHHSFCYDHCLGLVYLSMTVTPSKSTAYKNKQVGLS